VAESSSVSLGRRKRRVTLVCARKAPVASALNSYGAGGVPEDAA
jgi:hypothetical protein